MKHCATTQPRSHSISSCNSASTDIALQSEVRRPGNRAMAWCRQPCWCHVTLPIAYPHEHIFWSAVLRELETVFSLLCLLCCLNFFFLTPPALITWDLPFNLSCVRASHSCPHNSNHSLMFPSSNPEACVPKQSLPSCPIPDLGMLLFQVDIVTACQPLLTRFWLTVKALQITLARKYKTLKHFENESFIIMALCERILKRK